MTYGWSSMIKITKENAIKRWNNNKEVYLLYDDNTEAVAMSLNEINNFDGKYGYER